MKMNDKFAVCCGSLLLVCSLGAIAGNLPAGIYVGSGDGAKTVLKITPNGKAILGETDTYIGLTMGPNGKQVPQFSGGTTVKDYEAAVNGGYLGTVRQTSKNTYMLRFDQVQDGLKPCYHEITVTANGLIFGAGKPMQSCVSYHGASWGFGGGPKTILKKIK